MKWFKHIDIFIFILLLFFFLCPQNVWAIEYMHIGGKPANPDPNIENSESWFIYQLKPGEKKQDALTVLNNFDEAQDLLIYAADGVKSSSGGFAIKQLVEEKKEVGSWVKFYPDPAPEIFQELFLASNKDIIQFCDIKLEESGNWTNNELLTFKQWCQGKDSVELNLDPMSAQTIDFVFSVPLNLEFGEYTGGILIQKNKPDTTATQGGLILTTRVGVRIYQTVPGKIFRDLLITDFELKKLYKELDFLNLFSKNPRPEELLISTAIQNSGNVSVNFTENLIIKNELFNKESETIVDRSFQVLRNDVFVSTYSWQRPRFGKFNFVNQIHYIDGEDNQQTLTSQAVSMWFIPWREIIISLLVISVLLIIHQVFKKVKKSRSRHA